MTGQSVLIVEDDAELRSVLDRGLHEERFRVRIASTGAELLEQAEREAPDVFIIDVGLPDSDGRDLCQALRARGIQTPVLFLTARDALVDRIAGFDAGGDDYLVKPFAFVELVARLEALMRRRGAEPKADQQAFGLDPLTHAMHQAGAAASLTPTEFRVLAHLLSRPGEAVRRRDLVRAGWPLGAFVRDNTLDAYVSRLRRKLRGIGATVRIATVHGVGYKLE
jgi:two-component system OmpR family response regulator